MTDRELQKLRRLELLDMLLELRTEADRLRKENEQLREQLADSAAQKELLQKVLDGVSRLQRGLLPGQTADTEPSAQEEQAS